MKEIVVYHGTTKENAKNIKQMNRFVIKEDINNKAYLGTGIYFFEDYKHAIFWNMRNYKRVNYLRKNNITYLEYINNYDIVDAIINVEERNYLDLDDVNNIWKFDRLVRSIDSKLASLPEYQNATNKNAAIINYLQKNGFLEGILVISKFFKQDIHVSKLHSIKEIERKVICVKDDRIIKFIDIHEKISQQDVEQVIDLYC